jgi:hypothetical protein
MDVNAICDLRLQRATNSQAQGRRHFASSNLTEHTVARAELVEFDAGLL